MKYDIIAHGFEIGKDVTESEWGFYKNMFCAMYGGYLKCVSQNLKSVDEIWHNFEAIKNSGDMFEITRAARIMGVNASTTHDDYKKAFLHGVADKVNKLWTSKGFDQVEGYVYELGEDAIYCGRIKNHPGWTIELACIVE